MTALQCYAYRRGQRWHAICTDLDIAVDGESLLAVVASLETCIDMYLERVAELPAEETLAFSDAAGAMARQGVVGRIDLAPSSQGRRRAPRARVLAGISRRRALLTHPPPVATGLRRNADACALPCDGPGLPRHRNVEATRVNTLSLQATFL